MMALPRSRDFPDRVFYSSDTDKKMIGAGLLLFLNFPVVYSCSVDRKQLMRFLSETSLLKFPHGSLDKVKELKGKETFYKETALNVKKHI